MNGKYTTLNLKDQLHVDEKLEKIWMEYYNEEPNPRRAVFQREILKKLLFPFPFCFRE